MASSVFLWLSFMAYAVLIVSTAIVVVLENRQPAKTIAWLIVLVGIPVVGLIFFYFFGQDERRKYLLHRRNYMRITQRMLSAVEPTSSDVSPAACTPLAQMLERQQHAVLTTGNAVRLITSGRSFITALLRDIHAAREHIHLEMYIFEDDAVGQLVRDALTDKARQGVEVRLLYDDVGCWNVPQRFFNEMEAAGILIGSFLPVRFPRLTRRVNYRDHHKICIIDGRIGYVGGMNIALRYAPRLESDWRDIMLRIEGEAVGSLQRIFLVSWNVATGRLRDEQRFFPSSEQRGNVSMQVVSAAPVGRFPIIMYGFTWMAQRASRYLYIATPYFMPTEPVLQALQTAAMSGADVRLILPLKPDAFWLRYANESYFGDVLRAGIRVFLYTEGFMHAKAIVADDECCSVGSTNMDFRSFENNFEANAFIYNANVARQLRTLLESYMEKSREVNLAQWRKRPLARRMLESHTRILSPLL